MKRIFLIVAAGVMGCLLGSCADVGAGDPLDRTGNEGGTLYIRDME